MKKDDRPVANDRPVAVLWGAGCSFQAGIPLAVGVVDGIRQNYPTAFNRAQANLPIVPGNQAPSYAECMQQLDVRERRELIRNLVSRARINWAHLLLADFIRNGYVQRVFTTNFDPLIMRACA